MIRKLIVGGSGFLVSCAVILSFSQQKDAKTDLAEFPLSVWLSQKEVTQIPWILNVGKPSFRNDLRQELYIIAWVRVQDLEQSDLVLFARVLEQGRPLSGVHSVTPPAPLKPVVRNPTLSLNMFAIVRPGKYRIELALLDRATGRYNTRFENISVNATPNDPLAGSFEADPKFEFVPEMKQEPVSEDVLLPPWFPAGAPLPGILSRLGAQAPRLAGSSRGSASQPPMFTIGPPRTTHVSVITILTPPEVAIGEPYYLNFFQQNLSGILFPFTRLRVTRGSARLTAVDLPQKSRVFDRVPMEDVEADRLRREVVKDISAISLEAQTGKLSSGSSFRDVLKERLDEAAKDSSGSHHAIIVVGARMKFPNTTSLSPLVPAGDCHCEVYYLRFAIFTNENDDVHRLLKPYRPRVFEPLSWKEFREDFGQIYAQLAR